MRVVIDNATLRKHRSCRGAYTSPNWSESDQALIYPDWDAAVKRFLSTSDGIDRLDWLVAHKLVPMTTEEFKALKQAHGEKR